ncbi:MAG: hypothetical protein ACTHJW_23395 [Streptosporangiaceae bacterium]
MTDLERRLRAALRAASEPAPDGLLAAVMRRHRRHQLRIGASVLAIAVAAALAVPPVTAALHAGHRAVDTPRPGGSMSPNHRWRHPVAAAGTVLSGCNDGANSGAIGRNWRSGARHVAGPLWLIDGGHSSGRIRLYVAIAVLHGMKPGSALVVRTPSGPRHDLRFLYGPGDSLDPGTRYTMRSGEAGVTFEACQEPDGITDYYGGYLVRGKRCVPVSVSAPGLKQSVTIRLGACPPG